jgi:hypothetical protein
MLTIHIFSWLCYLLFPKAIYDVGHGLWSSVHKSNLQRQGCLFLYTTLGSNATFYYSKNMIKWQSYGYLPFHSTISKYSNIFWKNEKLSFVFYLSYVFTGFLKGHTLTKGTEINIMGFGIKQSQFQTQLHHSLALWPWAPHLPSTKWGQEWYPISWYWHEESVR